MQFDPDSISPMLLTFLVILFRAASMVSLMPGFGEQSIPPRVKLALAVSLTLVALPLVEPANIPMQSAGLVLVILEEAAIGLILGTLLRAFLFALQIAGSIAAQSTSLSQILGSAAAEPSPAVGHVVTMAGLAMAMLLGLPLYTAGYFVASFELLPIGSGFSASVVTQTVTEQISFGFRFAFALSAPFYILSILYNLTLGVINRAMPQLMVAFVGAPVITAGALLLLVFCAPVIIETWVTVFFGYLNTWEIR